MLIFRFRLQNNKGKSSLIEQKEINIAVPASLEVLAKRIDVVFGDLDVVFQDNIRLALGVVEELPACLF